MATDALKLLLSGPEFYFGHEGEEDDTTQIVDTTTEEDETQGDKPKADEDEPKGDDVEGLKSALAAERKRAKAAERELNKRVKAETDTEAEKADAVAAAQKKLQEVQERNEKLANGLLQRELEARIRKAANELNFVDPTDAIDGVDRSKLEWDQDEDDPSQIDIDDKAVEKAVKALATKKPHFVKRGTEDGAPTGSGFGGGNQGDRKDKDAALRARYSALNNH